MNQLILASGLATREQMVKHDVQFMYVYLSESNHRGRKQASGSALSSMEAEAREESLEAKEVQRRCSNLNEQCWQQSELVWAAAPSLAANDKTSTCPTILVPGRNLRNDPHVVVEQETFLY